MIADIAKMIREHQLTLFTEMHDFDDFQYALATSQKPYSFRKVVLNMDFPNRMGDHDKLPAAAFEVFNTSTVCVK